jgi:hypothetical protein
MRAVHIYGLFDPRSADIIMYVGKGGDKRPQGHWRIFVKTGGAVNARLRHWLKKLQDEGVVPGWRFLQENVEDWQTAERKWIAYWRFENPNLCNVADGGNAWPLKSCSLGGQNGGRENARRHGHEFFVRIGGLGDKVGKAKGGRRRKQLYPGMASEWGRRGGEALRGNLTDEARKKMSEAKKGKPSPRKGVILSPEIRQRMSEAALTRDAAGNQKYLHTRWHETRGIINPECQYCSPDFFDIWEGGNA